MHSRTCRLTFVGLLLSCLCLILPGCNQQKQPQTDLHPDESRPTYRIGLIPELSLFEQKKLYAPLLNYLSAELGVRFEILSLANYDNFVENFNKLDLDGAFVGSFTGAIAIDALGVRPIARPLFSGGSSTYYGMVFVRKGSGIHDAESMRGKRMVFVDKATTAGYLLPLSYFKNIGIDNYSTWFREFYFSGSHEDAILDVLHGEADIGAAKNTVYAHLAATNKRIGEELEILATSPHVPSNALVVSKDFPLELQEALRQKLLNLDKTDAGRSILTELKMDAFIDTSIEDYAPVRKYLQNIELDIKNYHRRNK
jgi:phosphonate transport system substrate-binding protein